MKIKLSALSFATVFSLLLIVSTFSFATADDTIRATRVLTPEIAQSVLGGPVKAQGSGMPDTEVGKTWVSRVHYAKEGSKEAVGLLIRHAGSKEESTSVFEQSKTTFSGVDVAGLGDKAYRTEKPAQLNVLKGANWLIIDAGTFAQPDTTKQEKIAREILPKVTF